MTHPPEYPAPPADPYGQPAQPPQWPAAPTWPAAQAPRKRRALLITSIVLTVLVVLCGGGGTAAYFLVRNVNGKGQPTPAEAVQGFLEAVYRDHDVNKALRFVCSEARDKAAISKKIEETRSYQQKGKGGKFTWPEPTVDNRDRQRATLTVPVKFSTSDEKLAEKKFTFVAVDESGWWVCEVGETA